MSTAAGHSALRSQDFGAPLFMVMVSSRIVGLRRERRGLKKAIESAHRGFRVWLSEDQGSSPRAPVKLCLEAARQCDCLVLLLGRTYGKPPSGFSKAITEMEWDEARRQCADKVLAYKLAGKLSDRRQRTFVEAVRDPVTGVNCPELRGIGQLSQLVVDDVIGRFGRIQRNESSRRHRRSAKPASRPTSEIKKQREYVATRASASSARVADLLLATLSREEFRALALLHTAGLMAGHKCLEISFPEIQWKRVIRAFEQRGICRAEDAWLMVAPNVEAVLDSVPTQLEAARRTWVTALDELHGFADASVARCIHLLVLGKHAEALHGLHELILGSEDSRVCELANVVLEEFSKTKPRLSALARFRLLDSRGLVQIRSAEYRAARETFNLALRRARQAKDTWAITLAILHRGSSWALESNHKRAIQDYGHALRLAKESKDAVLIGQILNNTALSILTYDVDEAERVLGESLAAKTATGDHRGFAASTALGIVTGTRGNHREALKHFRRATKIAKRWGDDYSLATSLLNESSALFHLGQLAEASKLGAAALAHAREAGRVDTVAKTLQGYAVQSAHSGQHVAGKEAFLELAEIKKRLFDVRGACESLTDAAVCAWRAGDAGESERVLRRSRQLAEENGDTDSALRAITTRVGCLRESGRTDLAARTLRSLLSRYRRRNDTGMVIGVASELAELLAEIGKPAKEIDRVWEIAAQAAKFGAQMFRLIELLRRQYAHNRDSGQEGKASSVLDTILSICARNKSLRRDYVEALDERASEFQRAGDFAAAKRTYKRALRIADRDLDGAIPSAVSNNVGELYRKTGRPKEAVCWYERSAKAATNEGDLGGELLTLGNLCLTLIDLKEFDRARQILEDLRTRAKRHGCWHDYALAWRRLGDLAWMVGRTGLAIRRYRRATEICEDHELNESLVIVGLNHARVLAERGRFQDAADLLEARRQIFETSEFALECFAELGAAHNQAGNFAEGKRALNDGRALAHLRGDDEAATRIESLLSISTRRLRLLKISQQALRNRARVAVRQNDWASLLSVLEAHVLKKSPDRAIQSALDAVITTTGALSDADCTQALREVAEALWDLLPPIATELALYTLWMATGESDTRLAADLGRSLVEQLHAFALRNGTRSFESLRRRLRTRIAAKLTADDVETQRLAVWPLEVVAAMLTSLGGGRSMGDAERLAIIDHAFGKGS